jgi:predicted Zn-dependent protease
MIMVAYRLGAQVGVLRPYGRLQESEADRIGLVLGAKAAYDAHVAIGVWQRMSALPGQRPPVSFDASSVGSATSKTSRNSCPQPCRNSIPTQTRTIDHCL